MPNNEIVPSEKAKAPPYADYHPFEVFLGEARKQFPEQVNRAYLKQVGVAKSAHQTLLVTLRFLGLIDTEGKPTLALTALLKDGEEFTKGLQELTKSVYPDLLAKPNISFGKRPDISRYFQETYSLSPYTAKRCATFFVRLAKDAKLIPSGKLKARETRGKKFGSAQRADLLAIKAEVLRKLPDFRNGWHPAEIQVVLQQFERLLSHLEK